MSDTQEIIGQGVAIRVACLVKSLAEADPEFEHRFVKNIEDAAYKIEGDEKVSLFTTELLSNTRSLLTGFTWSSGQGASFFDE
ncbi:MULTISPECIES: hypothetical protein [unclassified Devosia]|uniref:hypothetical protein n=1 Tax=unclassified Devosia TaxID=196773 RepID=UPI00145DA392|nr:MULTISPECIES: hypothetical protein [unclassified Devosia]MBJ6988600.1 hypothetical protein [Devosia sp. MC521]QMW62597.1 hypothetical protein H4N61_17165 [Devosia sp. MC521]